MISENVIYNLIKTKAKSGFTGEITLVFRAGNIEIVKKNQTMDNNRINREIKRDHNHQLLGKHHGNQKE